MPELKLIYGEKSNILHPSIIGSMFILREDILWTVYNQKMGHITWLSAGTRLKAHYISESFIYLIIVYSYDSMACVTLDAFKECLEQNKVVPFSRVHFLECLDGEKLDTESVGVKLLRRNIRANQEKEKRSKNKT